MQVTYTTLHPQAMHAIRAAANWRTWGPGQVAHDLVLIDRACRTGIDQQLCNRVDGADFVRIYWC